jgi:PAS domain S-box-containing protein
MTPRSEHLSRSGITRKIVVLLFFSAIVPFLVLAIVFFSFYFNGQKQAVIAVQQEIGDRISTSISAYLEKTAGQIQLFADLINPTTQSKEALQLVSYQMLDRIVEFDTITITDPAGYEVCKVSRYYSFRPFELQNISKRQSFRSASAGKKHIGKVEIPQFSRFPRVRISVPIVDPRDRITGVLIVGVNVMRMWDIISRHSIGENRYAYVVDSQGFLIAFRDPSSVLQKKDLGRIRSVHNLMQGHPGVFEYEGLAGNRVIGASALIPLTGWGVVVETAVADAYGGLYLLAAVFLVLLSATLALALILAFRFSYRGIIKPITLLQREAERIASGEFDTDLEIRSNDELGQLAASFKVMAENLKETTVSRDLLMEEIAEHQKTERALQRGENTLRSIFRAAPVGIGLVAGNELVMVNDRLCSMLGYERNELLGLGAQLFYHIGAESGETVQTRYGQIRRISPGNVENHWQRKDGERIDMLVSFTPLDSAEPSAGVAFTALDITEKKRSEQALQASGEIVRSIPSGLFVYQYEPEGGRLVLLEGNPAAERLTGIDVEALRGMEFDRIWPRAREEGVTRAFASVMETGQVFETEELAYRDNRLEGAFRIRAFPMPGRRLGVAFENITWQKRAEEKQQRLEDQLRQSQKMESIGTLAGGVAHDFNNILYMILGNTELALEDIPQGDPAHAYLTEIRKAGLRAAGIIKQLLNFSRKADHQLSPVDGIAIIEEALDFLRSTIPTSIEIRRSLPDDGVMILADPIQIHQVLMNLCTNASQAMEQGGGVLTLEALTVETGKAADPLFPDMPPAGYLKVSISDTGPGIADDALDRVFEPYFTTKEIGKGSGMGLAVVHGIISNHGGAIVVKNRVEGGATFSFLIPACGGPSLPEDDEAIAVTLGSEAILFVDDEKTIATMTRDMLERAGYRVEIRSDPFAALELFRSAPQRFDMVITDMTMPGMGGDVLARKVMEIRPEIPVIICTGYSNLLDKDKAEALGIAAFVMKPVVMKQITRVVREVLDKRNSARGSVTDSGLDTDHEA